MTWLRLELVLAQKQLSRPSLVWADKKRKKRKLYLDDKTHDFTATYCAVAAAQRLARAGFFPIIYIKVLFGYRGHPFIVPVLPASTEKIERTVQIEASTVEIEERGVKLRLTVVDTPGYGDAINSQDWWGGEGGEEEEEEGEDRRRRREEEEGGWHWDMFPVPLCSLIHPLLNDSFYQVSFQQLPTALPLHSLCLDFLCVCVCVCVCPLPPACQCALLYFHLIVPLYVYSPTKVNKNDTTANEMKWHLLNN